MNFGGAPARRLRENIAAAVRQGHFDRPPIGPVGALLSLSDDRWAAAVEVAIGSKCFEGYLVTNKRDLHTLKVCTLTPPDKIPCSPTSAAVRTQDGMALIPWQ